MLAPERYDPRISQRLHFGGTQSGQMLAQLVDVSRDVLPAERAEPGAAYIVLDTGDAKNGIISRKSAVDFRGIGSAKKILRPGDVIISRLRPYLRQVGFVDADLAGSNIVLASTEFYVLRPTDSTSIAYVVPFLLSERIQEILSASQEGGHHPRVPEKTLMSLVVPEFLLERSSDLSRKVERATEQVRQSEKTLLEAFNDIGGLLS